LISGALLKAHAIACHRDYFERRKMRLDDSGTVGLTDDMGKAASKKRAVAVTLASGE
jgi:hypothetical protein